MSSPSSEAFAIDIRPAERGDTRFLAWVMQEAGRSHLPKGIFDVAIPDDPALIGNEATVRWIVFDPAAPNGRSKSPIVRCTLF